MRISSLTILGALALLSTAACTINPAQRPAPTPVVVQAPMQQPAPAATVIVPRTY